MICFNGTEVVLIRLAKPSDAKLEGRKPDQQDKDQCRLGMLMIGRFADDNEERLFDLSRLRSNGGWKEIREAARSAGNDKLD